MPMLEKKLKAVVKSHYSHETRKDVNLIELNSLKLEKAWPFIKDEIVKEIGNELDLMCVPFIEETNFFLTSSCFVMENEAEGSLKPVGKLSEIVDETKSDPEYLEWINSKDQFVDEDFKFPHESVKITLQDEQVKNKVRVIMVHFFRHRFPADKSPVNKVYLSKDNGLKGIKSLYMITNVVMAKTVEFRATTGISSRIFHLGNPTPLVFRLEKFEIDNDGQLISQKCITGEKKNTWSKVDPHDQLYTVPSENLLLTS